MRISSTTSIDLNTREPALKFWDPSTNKLLAMVLIADNNHYVATYGEDIKVQIIEMVKNDIESKLNIQLTPQEYDFINHTLYPIA